MNRLPILLAFAVAALAADEERRTDALFAEFAQPGSPGCAVGVMRDGRTLHAKAYGLGDLEQGTPLSPRSVFYLASVSKQFMAFSVLLLEQQNKLSLDDPVGKHVAGLPAHTARITLRQLLHHTGGVRDYLALGFMAGFPRDHVWTEHAALNWIARQKATNFEPGAEHLYSNSGYVLLSLAAQRIIGGKLNDWMRQNVYSPLGMTSSRWQHNHADTIPARAHGYLPSESGWRISDVLLETVGDGGMYSSIEDMLKWAANFDQRRLGASLLDRMSQVGTLADGKPIVTGYGMGLSRGKARDLDFLTHGGSLAGYRTAFLRVPEKKFTVICFCNAGSANPGRITAQTEEIWLESELGAAPKPAVAPKPAAAPKPAPESQRPASPPKFVAVDPALLEAVSGDWWSGELATVYRLRQESGKLMLETGDAVPVEVILRGDGTLGIRNSPLTLDLTKDEKGVVKALVLNAGRVRGIEFLRIGPAGAR